MRLASVQDPPEHGSKDSLQRNQVVLVEREIGIVVNVERLEHEVGRDREGSEHNEEDEEDVEDIFQDLDDANNHWTKGSVEQEPSEWLQQSHDGPRC